jgi:hypothetical protein
MLVARSYGTQHDFMKQYRSISKEVNPGVLIYAFDKLDGSNIRVEWDRKLGFHKFGSRKKLLQGGDDSVLAEAVALIEQQYADALGAAFHQKRYQMVTCYFEFFGRQSRFGQHAAESHQVVLLDIEVYKKGYLPPSQLLAEFGQFGMPDLLYTGLADAAFCEAVKLSKLPGMTHEGVVCKSDLRDRHHVPIVFKIKTDAWLQALQAYCKGDARLYDLLC